MNILIVNETSDLGGAETMAIELANALSVIPGNQVAFASAVGILTERLESRILFFPISRYSSANIFKLFLEFRSIFREMRFDVIHSQGATIGIIAGIAARAFSPKTKVVITHHSAGFTRIPTCMANFLLKAVVDMSIAISKVRYNSFIRAGFNKKKVILISNFVDKERLSSQADTENIKVLKNSLSVIPNEKLIVGVGRLIFDKRFDVFIDVLVDCAQQAHDIKILGVILGDGPEYQHLQDMASRIELPNLKVKLVGFQENVAAYLKMADILLSTSEHREVLPMCLIEAISLGTPIVCSDIPGNNDIVENSLNGFLVNIKKKNYSAFMLRILNDDTLAKKFSLNGIEKSKRLYDKNKVVSDIFMVYKFLMVRGVHTQ